MKTGFVLFPIVLLCAIIVWPTANAQTREQREHHAPIQISSELESIYGPSYYGVTSVYDVDSLLRYDAYFLNPLEDPYGTLGACFIFVSSPRENKDGDMVGVYKDGHILWHSDTLNCGSNLDLLTTRDLNNEGKVDLVFEAGFDEHELWIFSWDGRTGERINTVNEDGSSAIDVEWRYGTFSFIDVEGDGVWEIKGEVSEDSSASWSWNGQEYGQWPNTSNTNILFPPANRIDLSVNSSVRNDHDTLWFNYGLFNNPTSKQRVEDFRVWSDAQNVTGVSSPPYWEFAGISGRGYGWFTSTDYTTGQIRVGKEMAGFVVKANALCAIDDFDSHGYNGIGWDKAWLDKPGNFGLLLKNQLENAFHGKTIGPADPPSPFDPQDYLDTLTAYTTHSRSLGWIKDQATANKYSGYFTSAKTSLEQNNTAAARSVLEQVLQQVDIDSTNSLTSEAYALIRYNTEYLLTQLPTSQPGFTVKLISSAGVRLTTGSLQYYEGSWKDATSHNEGTFSINTTAKNLSLRMTYEYGTQTKSNVIVGPDTVVFQTVNTQIRLQDSRGNTMDTGTVQYYAGAWRSFGTTANGVATKELLPNNYSFRMTYAYWSNHKQQNIESDPTVVFRTVNAAVQLEDSHGNLIDEGTVQYYAGAWRDFGTTSGGVATKELLPNNYTFRMTHDYVSNDKAQSLLANPTITFSTVLCTVRVTDPQGQPVDNVIASYYSGAWREIGSTVNGEVTKELLPANLTFRVTYGTGHQDKTQSLAANSTVEFQVQP